MKCCWLIFLIFVAGCVSFTPRKFEQQVHTWVPIGLPLAKAKKIMEHHGFECALVGKDNQFNGYGLDYLDCERSKVWFHDWNARFYLTNGKVSGYGPIGTE